jgi:hypothetical protein
MAAPRTTKAVEIAKPATPHPYDDAILNVSKRIADQELEVARKRSGQRACFVVLTLGNLVLAGIAAAAAWVLRLWAGWAVLLGVCIVGAVCLAATLWWAKRDDLREARVELTKLHVEKRLLLSRGVTDVVGARRRYREEISGFIDEYRREAKRNRRTHNYLQSIIIIGAIVTTSVTSAIGQAPGFKWAAVALSISVGIAAGFTGYFKFRERSMNLRQTADAIEHEFNAAELGIRRYRSQEADELLAELADQVEWLREEQRKREQQLEQPVEERSTVNQSV